MEIVRTSVFITKSTSLVAHEISKKTGITYVRLQNMIVESFLDGERKINPRLEIRAWTDPDYVKRTFREQFGLTPENYKLIKRFADDNGYRIGTVLFQAMLDFVGEWAVRLWTEDEFNELFKIEKKHPYDTD